MPDNTIISNLPVFLAVTLSMRSQVYVFSVRRLIQRRHSDRERVLHLRPCEPIPGVLRPTALIRTGI